MASPSTEAPRRAEVRRRGVLGCTAVAAIAWPIVPLPSGAGRARTTRSGWSAMLGLFAAVPIAYLVPVVLHGTVMPILAHL